MTAECGTHRMRKARRSDVSITAGAASTDLGTTMLCCWACGGGRGAGGGGIGGASGSVGVVSCCGATGASVLPACLPDE